MSVKIYAHNAGSEGARNLSTLTGYRRVRHTGSRVNLGARDVLINWGHAGTLPENVANAGRIINRPQAVRAAANKLLCFELLSQAGVRVVPHTVDPTVAAGWGSKVVVRHTLNGHSGEGIEIVENGLDIPAAPCYTEYIVKETEWRVHVLGGEVIDCARKIRDPNYTGEINWAIRNRAGGFIFARNSGEPSDDVLEQAINAVRASGLDFGAVDVMVNKETRRRPNAEAFVLEINTAPGIMGTTAERYAEAMRAYV